MQVTPHHRMTMDTEFYPGNFNNVQMTEFMLSEDKFGHTGDNANRTVVLVLTLFAIWMNLVIIILTLLPTGSRLPTQTGDSVNNPNSGQSEASFESGNPSGRMRTSVSHSGISWIRDVNFGCCLYRATFDCPHRPRKDRNAKTILSSSKKPTDNETFAEHEGCCTSLHPKVVSNEQDSAEIELKEKHKSLRLKIRSTEVKPNTSVTIYLVRFMAASDMCFMLTELILVWFLRPADTERPVFSKVKFNLECRLETMLSKLFCITSEWTLVIFGVERVLTTIRPRDFCCYGLSNCRASNWPNTLPSLDKLKLKVGMGLFIALLFATMCNYLWMTGETKIHTARHQNDIVPMPTLVCIVRSEFYNFYYKFFVYLEELAVFVLPHLCTTLCFLTITIQYGIQLLPQWCVCVHHITQPSNMTVDDRWQSNDDTNSLEQPVVNTHTTVLLLNLIFCLHALFRVVLSAPENWKRCLFLFSKVDTSKQTFSVSQELNFSKFTVSSSITVILLCWHLCRVANRNSDVVIV